MVKIFRNLRCIPYVAINVEIWRGTQVDNEVAAYITMIIIDNNGSDIVHIKAQGIAEQQDET